MLSKCLSIVNYLKKKISNSWFIELLVQSVGWVTFVINGKNVQIIAFFSVYFMARKSLLFFCRIRKNTGEYDLRSWKILVL